MGMAFSLVMIVASATGAGLAVDPPVKEQVIDAEPRQQLFRRDRSAERTSRAATRAECACQDACDAMWSSASASLQRLTGMRLRVVTDTMLETYVPRIGISGTVSKQALGGGKYLLVPEFRSIPTTGPAAQLASDARRMMTAEMDSAGKRMQCPQGTEPAVSQ